MKAGRLVIFHLASAFIRSARIIAAVPVETSVLGKDTEVTADHTNFLI